MDGCTVPTPKTITVESTTVSTEQNPFYTESSLYMKYPDFDEIKNENYTPAFEKGMADHMAEIDAIAERADSPTLENTIIAINWDSTQNQNGWLKSIILILYDLVPIYQTRKKNPLKRLMVKWPFYKPHLVRMY